VRITDPVTMRKAQSTPGLSTANYNQSVIHATYLNNKKKPFDASPPSSMYDIVAVQLRSRLATKQSLNGQVKFGLASRRFRE
jgi:hypothetical protein